MSEERKRPVQVHCAECARGGNGDMSCGAGWMVKDKRSANKFRMCFAGTPIRQEATQETPEDAESFDDEEIPRLSDNLALELSRVSAGVLRECAGLPFAEDDGRPHRGGGKKK